MDRPVKLFGTDGVRGVANTEPMTAETALKLGRAAAHVFKRDAGRPPPHRDRQGHAPLGLHARERARGRHLLDGRGRAPARAAADARRSRSSRAACAPTPAWCISASHNPYMDNGIKFFSRDGFKLPDEVEAADGGLIASRRARRHPPDGRRDGQGLPHRRRRRPLHRVHQELLPQGHDARRVDASCSTCANGAAYKVAPRIFTELGADVIVYNDEPERHEHQRAVRRALSRGGAQGRH